MNQLFPVEKEAHRSKFGEIYTKNFGLSILEPLFERVQQDIKHIQDLVEDGTIPSGIAIALLSKMDTKGVSRDVTLSNQLLDSESDGDKLVFKI